jgi:cell division protein ZapA
MSWQQTINVKIAERFYPLKIDKEEDEERIRKAGRLIDDRLLQYKQRYSDKDVQDFLAIAALQFAVKTIELEAKASSTEQEDKLKQLDGQLDSFLEQCADC